jgi:hypothetical protein
MAGLKHEPFLSSEGDHLVGQNDARGQRLFDE